MGSQRTNGKGAPEGSVVKRGSEVACLREGGGEPKKRSLAAGLDVFPTLRVGERMDKRQICQCESEHVWKMCLPQPFHLLHRGGYSHCLEVFSCVPLGPTRQLVTHLKVTFYVVQHHLKKTLMFHMLSQGN